MVAKNINMRYVWLMFTVIASGQIFNNTSSLSVNRTTGVFLFSDEIVNSCGGRPHKHIYIKIANLDYMTHCRQFSVVLIFYLEKKECIRRGLF